MNPKIKMGMTFLCPAMIFANAKDPRPFRVHVDPKEAPRVSGVVQGLGLRMLTSFNNNNSNNTNNNNSNNNNNNNNHNNNKIEVLALCALDPTLRSRLNPRVPRPQSPKALRPKPCEGGDDDNDFMRRGRFRDNRR